MTELSSFAMTSTNRQHVRGGGQGVGLSLQLTFHLYMHPPRRYQHFMIHPLDFLYDLRDGFSHICDLFSIS